jgi:hypothetical protein
MPSVRGLRTGASLIAVLLAVGCAPGSNSAVALPAAGPSSLTVPEQKTTSVAAATFIPLNDPQGGPRTRAQVVKLLNRHALVIGGETQSGATNQVLDFDPLTKHFTTLTPLADARYDHEATLLPWGDVLVTGGRNGSTLLASVELIHVDPANPLNTTTTLLSPLPEARAGHRAVAIPLTTKGGKPWSGATGVLIVDGVVPRPQRNPVTTASSLIYKLEVTADGVSGQAVVTASQPRVARMLHQAILLPGLDHVLGTDDDRVLVIGGIGADPQAISSEGAIGPISAAEVYEPGTERWSTVQFDGAVPGPRYQHRVVRTPDGRALLVGGQSTETTGPRLVEEIDLDPTNASTAHLSQGATLSRPRTSPEVVTLDDGRILVAGGVDPTTGASLADAEVLAANGQSVEPPISIGSPRSEHGMASLGLSGVLVFGGRATPEQFGSPASALILLNKR